MPACKECAGIFPNKVVIEGKARNLQHRTACLRCVPFRSAESRSRRADLPRKQSSTDLFTCSRTKCGKSFRGHNYIKDRGGDVFCSSRCKTIESVDRIRTERKRQAVEYKGGKCNRCGYCRCMAALDFHHLESSEKEFGINRSMTMSWDRIVKELDKCELLCANCHREEHSTIRV